jgi:hypothetical protein
MSRSLITENRNLRNKAARLEAEIVALRKQCEESCHESMVEELRVKYDVPKFLLSKTSYEVLERKNFAEIEQYMIDRARMIRGSTPKLVSEGG